MLQTPLKETEERELQSVRAAMEAAGDVAFDWDLESDSITWFGPMAHLSGLLGGVKVSTGNEFLRRIVPQDLKARRHDLAQHVIQRVPFDCEYRLRGTRGETVWLNERGSVTRSESGTPIRLTGTLRIITARKEHEARLRFEAVHDRLTGLYNRLRLADALDDIMAYNGRYTIDGAFLAVGIDRFSVINEAFGHGAGDAVLSEFAQRLDARPPFGDVVGRVGGDCFGVVLAHGGRTKAEEAAHRILAELRREPVDTPSGPIFVSASIGATLFRGPDQSPHDIMAKAEVALREAKRDGRNCCRLYESTAICSQDHRHYVEMAEQIRLALETGRLVFAYQPIVRAGTGEVAHYECLLRMIGEDGSLIAAGAFMPVIEEMGLVRQVDRHALDLAVEQLRANPDVSLAVNVSGLTAGDKTWLKRLFDHIDRSPDIAARLMVEITETVALRDIEESAEFVSAVRRLGCQVALDDFGAGYTSFKNLRALMVDVVKIDGSFVRNLALNDDNKLFIKSLVGLANGFSLTTVAECVETREDAEVLARHGVDLMQGYFFGRPDVARPWMGEAVQPN